MSDAALAGGDRISTWARAARLKLVETARSYHAVVTYAELAGHVQDVTDLRTNQLIQHWIGDVLYVLAKDCGRRDEPMLTALGVTQNGGVGGGYARAVKSVYGYEPEQLDDHAAEQRFRCYQHFGAEMPPDGGRPAVTAQVQSKRDKQRSTRQPARRGAVCPNCFTEMPVAGACLYCQ